VRKYLMFMDLYYENRVRVQVVDFSMVSRFFCLISRFFSPFLSWKRLVSRGLRINQGLFEFKWRGKKLVFREQGFITIGDSTLSGLRDSLDSTQGRLSPNRANPGLSDSISLGLAGEPCTHRERRGGIHTIKHNKTR
jgi:hypothetical protein